MRVLENECATLNIFNYVAKNDWKIKETSKVIEQRRILYFMGLLKISFQQVLYYYENEVFKENIKYDDYRMDEVDLNYKSIIDSENCIYNRFYFYSKFANNDHKNKAGYLYVFNNPKTGLTKIGVSKDKERRKSDLERSSGVELEEVNSLFTLKPYLMESFLHLVFMRKRELGEWFNLDKKDIEQINYFIKYALDN